MTNFEKHSEEIKKLLKEGRSFAVNIEGRVTDCENLRCRDCKFCTPSNCDKKRLEWLYEEAEKTREEEINEINSKYKKVCGGYVNCQECPSEIIIPKVLIAEWFSHTIILKKRRITMPNSLKCRIKKLAHEGKITEKESNELMMKLDGHDAEIRADAITECLRIVQKIKDDYNEARFGEQIPINYGTLCGIIIAFEQLKEQKNENNNRLFENE